MFYGQIGHGCYPAGQRAGTATFPDLVLDYRGCRPIFLHHSGMRLPLDKFRREQLSRSSLYRALLVLAAFVLAFQLIGSTFHKHDLTEASPDCASCYIVAHLPTGAPPAVFFWQAIALVVAYRIARLPQYLYVAEQSYLIPLSQAPPRRALST
jgi:hypothetical protein